MKTLGIFSGKQNTRGARHWKAESSRAAQLACGRAANLYLPAEKGGLVYAPKQSWIALWNLNR